MMDMIKFHRRYFPLASAESQISHLLQEIREFEKADTDHTLEELADIYIVGCSLKRWKRSERLADEVLNYFYYDFTEDFRKEIDKAVENKMQIVVNRVNNGEYFWNGIDYDRKRC